LAARLHGRLPCAPPRRHRNIHAALFRVLCYGYVKGIALDPEGRQPHIAARPDWFEVIHLYGTTGSYLNALRTVPEIVDCLNP